MTTQYVTISSIHILGFPLRVETVHHTQVKLVYTETDVFTQLRKCTRAEQSEQSIKAITKDDDDDYITRKKFV